MSDRKEVLRRQLIIEEDKYEIEKLTQQVGMVSGYCKVSKSGQVLISAKDLPDKKKVGLVLFARHIGHKLETEIPEEVQGDEIASYLPGVDSIGVEKPVNELIDAGLVYRTGSGTYRANPKRIQDFLDSLPVP